MASGTKRIKTSTNCKMSNKSKELINKINELLAQDTIPVYDIDSDEVEILSETVQIISTADAEYEIIEYKSDDEDIVEVTRRSPPG